MSVINCFAECGECSSCKEHSALWDVVRAAKSLLRGWYVNGDVYDKTLADAVEKVTGPVDWEASDDDE